jgi:hypothetical protein
MLTVAPRYHGLVQPPGARMILTGPGRDEWYVVGVRRSACSTTEQGRTTGLLTRPGEAGARQPPRLALHLRCTPDASSVHM